MPLPCPCNGTCGTATLANSLAGAAYTASYAYTHLGQLWQAPLNGQGAAQQYLYCDASHPHQLTGVYPTGRTCASLSNASYHALYESWGNVTERDDNAISAQLSYDDLDHFVQWNAGSTSLE
jgi:hypothetical protein